MNRKTRMEIVVRTMELTRRQMEEAFETGRMDEAIRLERRLENDWMRFGDTASAYWQAEKRLQKA